MGLLNGIGLRRDALAVERFANNATARLNASRETLDKLSILEPVPAAELAAFGGPNGRARVSSELESLQRDGDTFHFLATAGEYDYEISAVRMAEAERAGTKFSERTTRIAATDGMPADLVKDLRAASRQAHDESRRILVEGTQSESASITAAQGLVASTAESLQSRIGAARAHDALGASARTATDAARTNLMRASSARKAPEALRNEARALAGDVQSLAQRISNRSANDSQEIERLQVALGNAAERASATARRAHDAAPEYPATKLAAAVTGAGLATAGGTYAAVTQL